MKKYLIALWIGFGLSILNGVGIAVMSQNVIQQIYGGLSLLMATMLFCAIAIIAKIGEVK